MRILVLIALVAATPLAAQDMTFPTTDFPQPGTFCGPLQLCQPLTTRDAGN